MKPCSIKTHEGRLFHHRVVVGLCQMRRVQRLGEPQASQRVPIEPDEAGSGGPQRDGWLTLRPDVSWLLEEEAPP